MKKAIIICFILIVSITAFAQDSGFSARLASEEDLMIPVKIWGEVVDPGIYDVPIEYDLLGILSMAGGPINTAKLTNVKVIRAYKKDTEEPLVVYVDLDKYIETGDMSLIPEIRSGDTIMVPPKFGKNLYQSFAALLAIAQSITIMAFYIDRISDGN